MPEKEDNSAASLIERFPEDLQEDVRALHKLCISASLKKIKRTIVLRIEFIVTKTLLGEYVDIDNNERWQIIESFFNALYRETALAQSKKIARVLDELGIEIHEPKPETIDEAEERHEEQSTPQLPTYDEFMGVIQQKLYLDGKLHSAEQN